ncbi:MAG: hypothetical protein AAF982_02020 [Pseudomonadota bacterium]
MKPTTFLRRYIWNLLIAVDQLGNAILFGDPDETISSRCAKHANAWGWKQLGRFLEWIDPGHLADAIEHDEGKDQLL